MCRALRGWTRAVLLAATTRASLNATRQQLGLARTWLLQMGRGARRAGVTVQYCMTYARMLLQSVEVPTVSQFRASDDYGAGNDAQCGFPYCVYYVGTTSILAHAMQLGPSKDNYWSTPLQGGSAHVCDAGSHHNSYRYCV